MSTLIAEPGAEVLAQPPRSRRWLVLAAAIVTAIALVAALVAGFTYWQLYQPIVWGGGQSGVGELTADSSKFVIAHPAHSVENAFGDDERIGPVPRGGRIGFVINLSNTGRFPVSVVGVRSLLDDYLSSDTRLFAATDERNPQATLAPVSAVSLPAHSSRTVGFAINVRRCDPTVHTGGWAIVQGVTLRYRFDGLTHTANVPLTGLAVSLGLPDPCPA